MHSLGVLMAPVFVFHKPKKCLHCHEELPQQWEICVECHGKGKTMPSKPPRCAVPSSGRGQNEDIEQCTTVSDNADENEGRAPSEKVEYCRSLELCPVMRDELPCDLALMRVCVREKLIRREEMEKNSKVGIPSCGENARDGRQARFPQTLTPVPEGHQGCREI